MFEEKYIKVIQDIVNKLNEEDTSKETNCMTY